jgi:pimeloyl-ACP methyl ester carboxylesterase
MATYVLIHGGWAGGWQFKQVEQHLQQSGHIVYRPTLTGHGERVHLASPEVGLDTHIQDILGVFKYEELEDVILTGYSYGGMIVTGVAEQIPQHIRHLVYLDAYLPEDGQSLADLLGEDITNSVRQIADAYGDGWRIPHDPPDAHLRTDQLILTGTQPLSVKNPQAARLPKTFIHCTGIDPWPLLAPINASARMAQTDPNWQYYEIAAAHGEVWETHAKELSDILLSI